MATKVFESARDVAGVVYAPMAEDPADLKACAEHFEKILKECGAAETGCRIL